MGWRSARGAVAVGVLVAGLASMALAADADRGVKPRTLTVPPPAQIVVQGGEAPADVVAAVEYAANRWAQYVTSFVPIVIEIDWEPLGDQTDGVGSSRALHDFPGALLPDTWYPMPLADALAGEDLEPGPADIQLVLNSELAWHTGTDPSPDQPDHPDLVSVAMHELGHGLGFHGWIHRDPETGVGEVGPGDGEGMPGIYDRFVDVAGSPVLDLPSPSQELGDALISGQLTWRGPFGTEGNGGEHPALPSDPGSGSPYFHLDQSDAGRYPGAVAIGMLGDMGWPFGPAALHTPRGIEDACPEDVPEDGYADVDAANTHESAIDCAVAWGITNGAGADSYAPSSPVTRAQMASFVARLIEESGGELPEGDDAFTDDDGDAYAAHERNIDRLAAAGIVRGRGDGTYAPGEAVSRAQMATFLVRAVELRIGDTLGISADFFWDDDASSHAGTIDAAATFGFSGGRPDGTYAPAADVQRDQMASFLIRGLDLLVEDGLTSYPG